VRNLNGVALPKVPVGAVDGWRAAMSNWGSWTGVTLRVRG